MRGNETPGIDGAAIAGAETPIAPASTAVSAAMCAEFWMVAAVFWSVDTFTGSPDLPPPNIPLKIPASPPLPSSP